MSNIKIMCALILSRPSTSNVTHFIRLSDITEESSMRNNTARGAVFLHGGAGTVGG
jgi:hypothetical protein